MCVYGRARRFACRVPCPSSYARERFANGRLPNTPIIFSSFVTPRSARSVARFRSRATAEHTPRQPRRIDHVTYASYFVREDRASTYARRRIRVDEDAAVAGIGWPEHGRRWYTRRRSRRVAGARALLATRRRSEKEKKTRGKVNDAPVAARRPSSARRTRMCARKEDAPRETNARRIFDYSRPSDRDVRAPNHETKTAADDVSSMLYRLRRSRGVRRSHSAAYLYGTAKHADSESIRIAGQCDRVRVCVGGRAMNTFPPVPTRAFEAAINP